MPKVDSLERENNMAISAENKLGSNNSAKFSSNNTNTSAENKLDPIPVLISIATKPMLLPHSLPPCIQP